MSKKTFLFHILRFTQPLLSPITYKQVEEYYDSSSFDPKHHDDPEQGTQHFNDALHRRWAFRFHFHYNTFLQLVEDFHCSLVPIRSFVAHYRNFDLGFPTDELDDRNKSEIGGWKEISHLRFWERERRALSASNDNEQITHPADIHRFTKFSHMKRRTERNHASASLSGNVQLETLCLWPLSKELPDDVQPKIISLILCVSNSMKWKFWN